MSVEMIRRQLKNAELNGIYLLYGEENYLKSFYCAKIAEKSIHKGTESFNLQKFDGGNFSVSQFAAAVANMPLMSEKKCVVLRDVDVDGLKAAEWKETESILKNLPEECVVIIHYDTVRQDKKSARWKSLTGLVQKNGVVVEIGRQPKRELVKWLEKRAKSSGCEISEANMAYLIERCGEDMLTLASEADKICASAAGLGRPVEKEDIDALAVKQLDSSIYDLAKSVVGGRLSQGLKIIGELCDRREEPVMILSALSGAFCDLYRAKAALSSKEGQTSVEKDFNYRGREFRVRNAMRDCRNLDTDYLRSCLDLLMDADRKLKGSRTDSRIVLEQLITRMHRAGMKIR